MTVILGINLCDKVYLAGDSRLSYYENDEMYIRHDNMQKVENIPSTRSVTVASAGDAKFAKFLLHKLRRAEFINGSITEIREAMEPWIGPTADEFITQNDYSSVTLIIGGSDPSRHKVIDGGVFREMANTFTGGQGVIRVSQAIQEVIKPGQRIPDGEIELNIPDTQLFSVRITPSSIDFFDTKWGEFLIYGPEGLVRESIGIQDIAKFELDPTFMDNGSGMGNDMASINAFIYSQAERNNLSSVGGSVLVFANNSDGTTHIVTGTVYVADLADIPDTGLPQQIRPTIINTILIQGNSIYREVNGTRHKLVPVSKYRPSGQHKMQL